MFRHPGSNLGRPARSPAPCRLSYLTHIIIIIMIIIIIIIIITVIIIITDIIIIIIIIISVVNTFYRRPTYSSFQSQ